MSENLSSAAVVIGALRVKFVIVLMKREQVGFLLVWVLLICLP